MIKAQKEAAEKKAAEEKAQAEAEAKAQKEAAEKKADVVLAKTTYINGELRKEGEILEGKDAEVAKKAKVVK